MPFLVDSVTAALNGLDHSVQLVLHPVVRVRPGRGRRAPGDACPTAKTGARRPRGALRSRTCRSRSSAIFEPAEVERVLETLEAVLADVRAAVEDWGAMRAQVWEIVAGWEADPPPVPEAEIDEAKSFLRWLDEDHFTFLGYRELDLVEEDGRDYLRLVPGTSLGVLRVRETEDSHRLRPLTEKMSAFARKPQLLFVTKANHRATVHRPSHMDYVGLKRFDAEGRGDRRASLPRPVHLGRLQPARAHHPAAAGEGGADLGAGRLPAGQPRRQGPGPHPGDLPARRAVPDLGEAAVRDQPRDPPAPGAPAHRPVRPPGPLRALRLVPGLRAPGPLQHRAAPGGAGDPGGRPSPAR